MRFFVTVAIVSCVVVLTSCSSSKNTTQNSGTARSSYCQNVPFDKEPVIGWQKATLPDMTAYANVQLPKAYDAYLVNDADMKAFFVYAGAHKAKLSFSIPLPKPLDCQYFEVVDAGTMAPELQAKYPEIVSMKGNGTNTKSADIRLNYDGTQMKAQVTWDGSIYYVMPIQANGNTYYLVYDRKDTNEIKAPFEQDAPDNVKAVPSASPAVEQVRMLQDR